MSLSRKERVIVALDSPDLAEIQKLTDALQGTISFYKVGLELFCAKGAEAIKLVKTKGARVFLDLKLHDIPNTVAKTVAALQPYEVDLMNVHALGGIAMMKAAREALQHSSKAQLIAVTLLTSHNASSVQNELGISGSIEDRVLALAQNAKSAGLNGVVCSPLEITEIRKQLGSDFLIVTPGIRPQGSDKQDQNRVLSPKEAFDAGADYIVIGRPITAAKNPREAAESIIRSL